MSEYYEDEEYYDDEYYDDGRLSEEELDDILAEYRRRELIEHLTGCKGI